MEGFHKIGSLVARGGSERHGDRAPGPGIVVAIDVGSLKVRVEVDGLNGLGLYQEGVSLGGIKTPDFSRKGMESSGVVLIGDLESDGGW